VKRSGGFLDEGYWSSSEYSQWDAWSQYFSNGHKPERTRARDGWSGRFASFNFTFFANDLKNDKGDIAFIVFCKICPALMVFVLKRRRDAEKIIHAS
jgi:hypothetical protein